MDPTAHRLDEAVASNFVEEARRQLASSAGMIRHCLAQLDDAQVWQRPSGDRNSIANLVLHLAGNLRQRFGAVIGGLPDVRDRLGEFTQRTPIPIEQLLERFDEAVALADGCLAGLDSERLVESRTFTMLAGPLDRTVLSIAFLSLTHLAGHTQEIIHLTRAILGDRYRAREPSGFPGRETEAAPSLDSGSGTR